MHVVHELFRVRKCFTNCFIWEWCSGAFNEIPLVLVLVTASASILLILGGVKCTPQLHTVHFDSNQQSNMLFSIIHRLHIQFNLIHAPMKMFINTIKHKTWTMYSCTPVQCTHTQFCNCLCIWVTNDETFYHHHHHRHHQNDSIYSFIKLFITLN